MPVTVIALLTINEDDPMALAEYFKVTGPFLERAGAKIARHFKINDAAAGSRPAKSIVVVEYPDKAAVESVFQSEEYQSNKEVRDRAFFEYAVTIATDVEPIEEPAVTLD